MGEPIRVFLRCRPHEEPNDLFSLSLANSTLQMAISEDFSGSLGRENERFRETEFRFHGILDEDATQEDVYELLAQDCVGNVAEGVNATIFAYGPSGAGKTYSITGSASPLSTQDEPDEEHRGLIPRALEELFQLSEDFALEHGLHDSLGADSDSAAEPAMSIAVSFLEIANDMGRDLLEVPRNQGRSRSQSVSRSRAGSSGGSINELNTKQRFRSRANSNASGGVGGGGGSDTSVGTGDDDSVALQSALGKRGSRTRGSRKLAKGAAPILRKVAEIIEEQRRAGLPDPSISQIKDVVLRKFSAAEFRDARGAIVAQLKASVIDAVQTATGEVEIRNLSVNPVSSLPDALELFARGTSARSGAQSPGCHTIFTITVETRSSSNDAVSKSKLSFVDLAGSNVKSVTQRGQSPVVSGGKSRPRRGSAPANEASAGLSLHHFHAVVHKLQEISSKGSGGGGLRRHGSRNGPHVPYRNSLLTRVLRDALGGKCKTRMLACVSQDPQQIDETISTCRMAHSVATIHNMLDCASGDGNQTEPQRLQEVLRRQHAKAAEARKLEMAAKQRSLYWLQKEAAENERRERERIRLFDERSFRSLSRFYREHDPDMIHGVADVVEMLQHDEDEWATLCDNLADEFDARPVPHDQIDAIWESEEAVRLELEAAQRKAVEAEEEAQRQAAIELEIREKAAKARDEAERKRQAEAEAEANATRERVAALKKKLEDERIAAIEAAEAEVRAAKLSQEKAQAAADAAATAAKRRWARLQNEAGDNYWYDVDTQETTFERPDGYLTDEDAGACVDVSHARGLKLRSPRRMFRSVVKRVQERNSKNHLANVVHSAYDNARMFAERVSETLQTCGAAIRKGYGSTNPNVWREHLVTLRQLLAVLESGALALPTDSVTVLSGRVDSMITLVCDHLEGTPSIEGETEDSDAPSTPVRSNAVSVSGRAMRTALRQAASTRSHSPTGAVDLSRVADAVTLRRLIGVICGPTTEEDSHRSTTDIDDGATDEWRQSFAATIILNWFRRLKARRVADARRKERQQRAHARAVEQARARWWGGMSDLPVLSQVEKADLSNDVEGAQSIEPQSKKAKRIVENGSIRELLQWLAVLFSDPVALSAESLVLGDWLLIRDALGRFVESRRAAQVKALGDDSTAAANNTQTAEEVDQLDKTIAFLKFVGELVSALVPPPSFSQTARHTSTSVGATGTLPDVNKSANFHSDGSGAGVEPKSEIVLQMPELSVHHAHDCTVDTVGRGPSTDQPSDGGGAIEVFVRTMKGVILTLFVGEEFTVGHVKELVRRAEKIPSSKHVRLIFGGRELHENNADSLTENAESPMRDLTLRDYGVAAESTVHLVVSSDESQPPAAQECMDVSNADEEVDQKLTKHETVLSFEHANQLREILASTADLLQRWEASAQWEAERTGLVVRIHAAIAAARSANQLSVSLETAVTHALAVLDKAAANTTNVRSEATTLDSISGANEAELPSKKSKSVPPPNLRKGEASALQSNTEMSGVTTHKFQQFVRRRPWRGKAWRKQKREVIRKHRLVKQTASKRSALKEREAGAQPVTLSSNVDQLAAAAVLIQAWYRSVKSSIALRAHVDEAVGSAFSKMDAAQFRDHVFGTMVKWLDRSGSAASAVKIQTWYRGLRERRQLLMAQRATLLIQKMARQSRARAIVTELRQQQQRSSPRNVLKSPTYRSALSKMYPAQPHEESLETEGTSLRTTADSSTNTDESILAISREVKVQKVAAVLEEAARRAEIASKQAAVAKAQAGWNAEAAAAAAKAIGRERAAIAAANAAKQKARQAKRAKEKRDAAEKVTAAKARELEMGTKTVAAVATAAAESRRLQTVRNKLDAVYSVCEESRDARTLAAAMSRVHVDDIKKDRELQASMEDAKELLDELEAEKASIAALLPQQSVDEKTSGTNVTKTNHGASPTRSGGNQSVPRSVISEISIALGRRLDELNDHSSRLSAQIEREKLLRSVLCEQIAKALKRNSQHRRDHARGARSMFMKPTSPIARGLSDYFEARRTSSTPSGNSHSTETEKLPLNSARALFGTGTGGLIEAADGDFSNSNPAAKTRRPRRLRKRLHQKIKSRVSKPPLGGIPEGSAGAQSSALVQLGDLPSVPGQVGSRAKRPRRRKPKTKAAIKATAAKKTKPKFKPSSNSSSPLHTARREAQTRDPKAGTSREVSANTGSLERDIQSDANGYDGRPLIVDGKEVWPDRELVRVGHVFIGKGSHSLQTEEPETVDEKSQVHNSTVSSPKVVRADTNLFDCEFNCGFSGLYDVVAAHELLCGARKKVMSVNHKDGLEFTSPASQPTAASAGAKITPDNVLINEGNPLGDGSTQTSASPNSPVDEVVVVTSPEVKQKVARRVSYAKRSVAAEAVGTMRYKAFLRQEGMFLHTPIQSESSPSRLLPRSQSAPATIKERSKHRPGNQRTDELANDQKPPGPRLGKALIVDEEDDLNHLASLNWTLGSLALPEDPSHKVRQQLRNASEKMSRAASRSLGLRHRV